MHPEGTEEPDVSTDSQKDGRKKGWNGAEGLLQLATKVTSYNDSMNGSVAEKSKLLFNNVHMLRVARAIGVGGDVVDSKTLQVQLGLGQSTVQRILVTLEGVGLMERLERQGPTEPVQYQRVTHIFWDAAQALADA